jgi:thioredoxin 1
VKEIMMVQELTVDLFQDEVLGADVPVLVDFWSPGCGPCRLQDAVLKELVTEGKGRFQVKRINVWDEPELATRFQISAVPTLLIFDHGEVVRSLVGYQDKVRILRALQEAA